MLAIHQALEVRESVLSYLQTTYPFKERAVARAFLERLEDPVDGLFKGPYVSVDLPFVQEESGEVVPLDIGPGFPPYAHQMVAFRRLSTKEGRRPEATLLTTGTGSGKTEAFLYPLLDHCARNAERKGIKAIILYPMNALATDQAGRIAEAVYADERLKGRVSAGLFIGEGSEKGRYPTGMGERHVIENREALLASPPDILLTNFKMLDYGLMKGRFHNLWRYNVEDPSLLQFLVLDELHTYDGAQGTDVANLLRRLKLKLGLERGNLCPVGTSATIGSGEEAPVLLAEYASRIFGEEITTDAVVSEQRVDIDAFFAVPPDEMPVRIPSAYKTKDARFRPGETYAQYLERQYDLWQIDPTSGPLNLGRELLRLKFFRDLLLCCTDGPRDLGALIDELALRNGEFRLLPMSDESDSFNPRQAAVLSALALLAAARNESNRPLLTIKAQLWIRELSNLLRCLTPEPSFAWASDQQIGDHTTPVALPMWFCRDCQASGWLGLKFEAQTRLERQTSALYQRYFANDPNVWLINTNEKAHEKIDEYAGETLSMEGLNPVSLELHEHPEVGDLAILAYRNTQNGRAVHDCPECNSRNSIGIVGSRVSTLSSVVTGQILSSDLDPADERDRKLLIFANSVQDAAHLAGYVQARNYRFMLRTALQQLITREENLISLADIHHSFLKSLPSSSQEEEEIFVRKFFPPDREGDIYPKDYKMPSGRYQPEFLEALRTRVRWEITSEFGYNALVGRTLELTESSAAGIDHYLIQRVSEQLLLAVSERGFHHIKPDAFFHFIVGITYRMRTRGGVSHPYLEKFRTNGLNTFDLNWGKDKTHLFNPTFAYKTRIPRILSTREGGSDETDAFFTKQDNWYHHYFRKCFPAETNHPDAINEFYLILMDALADCGIVEVLPGQKGIFTYCIKPAAIQIGHDVALMRCSHCGSQISVPTQMANAQDGMPCLHYRCQDGLMGVLALRPDATNYYTRVYTRSRSPRIFAAEHTGLLERDYREQIESSFKERPQYDSLNTLVATSTLEMGIDIGDLNIAMNSAVPPLVSNFLQRIGRAGRKSGSALLVNFCSSKPHDLYYFDAPAEMMQGRVHTPGCYLEAREILKRHYLAFCIDSWTTDHKGEELIPHNVKFLSPGQLNLSAPDFFVNRLITYMQEKGGILLPSFRTAYAGEVAPSVFEELGEWIQNGGCSQLIRKAFADLKDEVVKLQHAKEKVTLEIQERKLKKGDEEFELLNKERRSLGGMLKEVSKRMVVEYMTNEGLLPNYAFPETGVTLSARVVPVKGDRDFQRNEIRTIEVVRPASQAIREFAPGYKFYTHGYKLTVGGLQVLNWNEESRKMRFCSACDHLEPEALSTEGPCPKCGDQSWLDAANTKDFVKLQRVHSFDKENEARLNDSQEEREIPLALTTRHLSLDKQTLLGGYAIRDLDFGYEFFRQIQLTEVNESTSRFSHLGDRVTINNTEVPAAGYITCRHCGHSTAETHRNGKPKAAKDYHFAYCKYRSRSFEGQSDEIFNLVFLYREFQTEGLKIRVPNRIDASEDAVKLYRAGLELGLRQYFKGNPQHISMTEYREYNEQRQRTESWLVLYDRVPGGTGYLEQLFRKEAFQQILQHAWEAIKGCSCQYRGKDGCYHCVYSYGNQYHRQSLSRETAEKYFTQLVERFEDLEFFPDGISTATNPGRQEELELEERFVGLLSGLPTFCPEENWEFEEQQTDGRIWYSLRQSDESGTIEWSVIPQIDLGQSQGVSLPTRPDFICTCRSLHKKGYEESPEALLPIAIYLDGYRYHATEDGFRFSGDVRKRRSVVQSNAYLTWTLTWDDINRWKDQLPDAIGLRNQQFWNNLDAGRRRQIEGLPGGSGLLECAPNNVGRFLHILKSGWHIETFQPAMAMMLTLPSIGKGPRLSAPTVEEYLSDLPFTINYATAADAAGNYTPIVLPLNSDQFGMHVFGNPHLKKVQAGFVLPEKATNLEKQDWEVFWHLYNLVQVFDTELSIRFYQNADQKEVVKTTPKIEDQPAEDLLAYYDESYHDLIRLMHFKGIPVDPEGSFFLDSAGQKTEGEACLGMHNPAIVIDPLGPEDCVAFTGAGYEIVDIETFQKILETL